MPKEGPVRKPMCSSAPDSQHLQRRQLILGTHACTSKQGWWQLKFILAKVVAEHSSLTVMIYYLLSIYYVSATVLGTLYV